ncbi:hypothetical protein [Synechococcus sp. BMK-MC-1]|uniref:hypothetical protein n=1 Tax=Synechococcus sp. BMK-MC-1 TaxID=1442551 RepID=UPI0016440D35|nr:hypothetical protein [Synechococcus sp. BMK-MC-1]QNI66425.1 hypothetical protein SynBMKMC1_00313 [Synechococcus sp. BMK-MC-1]
MGKLLSLKIKSEQHFSRCINLWRRALNLPFFLSIAHELHNSSDLITDVAASNKVIIAGNGPSFNLLGSCIGDLHSVDIITSNYAYKSPFFRSLSPKLHFIIDSKIVSGIWSLDMIDEVLAISPSTVIVLDARWKHLSEFHRFRDNPHIAWIMPIYYPSYYSNPKRLSFVSGFHGLNVTACAFSVASILGYKSLAFIGVEADGLFREIIDTPSHFYSELKKDQSMSSYESMIDSLYLSSYALYAWSGFVRSVEAQGIDVSNLSDQGIFDVCKRQKLDNFIVSDYS